MQSTIRDLYPLSPMQSGFLFQSLYQPESDAYFVQTVFDFQGNINPTALNSAWQALSNTHPILRTGFVWQDGEEAAQYVLDAVNVPFVFLDWQNFDQTLQQSKLNDFIKN